MTSQKKTIDQQDEINRNIIRLIELKKIEFERELNSKEAFEKAKLEIKFGGQYANLTGQELEEEQKKIKAVKTTVESEDLNPLVADYKNLYSKESWYKEPIVENGRTELTFPSQEVAANFFQDQAVKNRGFIVVDSQNKVIAYSNGDGKLYHSDGNEFKKGDKLTPSEIDLDQFQIPEKKSDFTPN